VEVFTGELTFIELLAAVLVDDMSLVGDCVPAVTVYAAGFFINVEALSCLHQNRFSVLVVEVAHQVMGVEIMFLDTERCRYFSALIQIFSSEHRLAGQVLNNVVGLRVG
jgi:hypothetical protein